MALELTETVKVNARLTVTTEHGVTRDATHNDLRELGWLSREDIYDRIVDFMHRVGLDPDGDHSLLRSFVEDACGSNGIVVWTCSDWESIRNSYYEMLKGAVGE